MKQEKKKLWFQVELNVLKFEFLLTISTTEVPNPEAVSLFAAKALRLVAASGVASDDEARYDACLLAIHTLASRAENLNVDPWKQSERTKDIEKGRVEYQAALLLQRLTQDQTGKEQRQLQLYSTRLHMILGLSTIAYEAYFHAKLKEMLLPTLSHYLLTRIAHIHPFDSRNCSVEAQLEEVFNKEAGMAMKAQQFFCPAMLTGFPYHTAFDLMCQWETHLSSIAKHLCMVEKRRAARLRGEMVDDRVRFRNMGKLSLSFQLKGG
jgi:N-terminal acetyltransferase B complex non-catalytic subunit